ncbi:MAG: hypothetical protein ACREP1_12220, partial [Rhodanobacteraceae bacterium]
MKECLLLALLLAPSFSLAQAQMPAVQHTPDVSNKALITTATPNLDTDKNGDAATLHKLADDFYNWRNEQFPGGSSGAGLHTWDDRLTNYAPEQIAARAAHVTELLQRVNAMQTSSWPNDERIDWI